MCCAWCLVFLCALLPARLSGLSNHKRKTTRTRHATHPSAVPVVEGDAEGGGGGGLANGPLDGRTNRGSNPRRRRAPAIAYTTRPSMPLMLSDAKMVVCVCVCVYLCVCANFANCPTLGVIESMLCSCLCACVPVFWDRKVHPSKASQHEFLATCIDVDLDHLGCVPQWNPSPCGPRQQRQQLGFGIMSDPLSILVMCGVPFTALCSKL